MELYNFTKSEVVDILNGKTLEDHYRKMSYFFGEENALGFYYKEFISLKENAFKDIDELINFKKQSWSSNEYTWEHYLLLPKIALINRLEELKGLTKLNESPIKGLALYQGYPVGVLVPRLLAYYYKSLNKIKMDELLLKDRKIIFEKVTIWVEELIKRGVYPINIYGGNIIVDTVPDLDVVLDGLDETGVVRIETKEYADSLRKRGFDLEKESFDNLNKIKKLYLK